MNFCVVNLGCKVNRVESDDVIARLSASGCETNEALADLIVINSCTVTGEAEKKTRKAVRRALRANDFARVIVTGCSVAIDPDYYQSLDERVRVVNKQQLSSALEAYEQTGCAPTLRVGEGFRTRVGVKIQDGCNHACTYCIVHVARGRATSRNANEVLEECVELAQAGVKEIVLTGINIGSYRSQNSAEICTAETGGDKKAEPINLTDLLKVLLKRTAFENVPEQELVRFRISSIEPRDVTDELIALMKRAHGRICRHLHLPLQSGSTAVLQEMARPYSSSYFLDLVKKLYDQIPEMSISTDIIVGFPGETEEQFLETMDAAKKCRFGKIHVFPYSERAGTQAAARNDQVPFEVRTRRAAQLRHLGDILRHQEYQARLNTTEYALVEEGGIAMSESYFELPVSSNVPVGSLVKVTFSETNDCS